MKIFFALLLITFVALNGYHLTFRGVKMPFFSRKLYFTGTEFIFLGILLGPVFFNLLDQDTIAGLEPIKALVLGWIGLLFGFQFEISKLKRFPAHFFQATLVDVVITFVLILLFVYFVLPLFTDISFNQLIPVSLTLSAVAACSAQTGIALFAKDFPLSINKDSIRLLRYMTSINSAIALMIFGVAYIFKTPIFFHTILISKLLIGPAIGIMAAMGLLFIYIFFLSQKLGESELALVIIGMAILTSATAMIHNFSPLLTNFFFGFILVNISTGKERIFNILSSIEKPLYLLLLVFLGSALHDFSIWILFFAIGSCFFRMLGKLSGGVIISMVIPKVSSKSRNLGFGLLEQGGLPLAIVFDFQHGFAGCPTDAVLSIALVGIILNDFISPNFINRLFKESKS